MSFKMKNSYITKDFLISTMNTDQECRNGAIKVSSNEFRSIRIIYLRRIFANFNYLYAPSVENIEKR